MVSAEETLTLGGVERLPTQIDAAVVNGAVNAEKRLTESSFLTRAQVPLRASWQLHLMRLAMPNPKVRAPRVRHYRPAAQVPRGQIYKVHPAPVVGLMWLVYPAGAGGPGT